MIKQDYIVRMIQEILALLINVILNKKKLRQNEWEEYDNLCTRMLGCSTDVLLEDSAEQLIDRFKGDKDYLDKLELVAMYQLKIADEMKEDNLVFRTRLKYNALFLLKYIQEKGTTFSLPRLQIIQLLEKQIQ